MEAGALAAAAESNAARSVVAALEPVSGEAAETEEEDEEEEEDEDGAEDVTMT